MLALRASVARFVRAIAAAGVSGVVTAAIASQDALKDVVVNVVSAVPFLTVESDQTVAVIVFAGLVAALLAVDKELRDRGVYGNVLEK